MIRTRPVESRKVYWHRKEFDGHQTLVFSLPYINTTKTAGQYKIIAPGKEVDPHGILEDIRTRSVSRDLVYTEDNVVEFFSKAVDDNE